MIWQALHFDGLPLLLLAVIAAGIVRGFSGFGTGMVFMPIAGIVLEPIHAILAMLMFDLMGPLILLPKAWRDGEPKDVSLLGVGALVGLPIGLYLLTRMDPIVFRWLVSCLALILLVLLTSGWRYTTPLNTFKTMIVGTAGGLMCGVAALPGPPVILSYMSSARAPAVIRGNTMMYLVMMDFMAFFMMGLKGLLVAFPIMIGAILIVPYTVGGMIGTYIFNPEKEKTYRRVAYAIIAFSAIAGMPIWDLGADHAIN